MLYISTLLITLMLFVLNVSLLPTFWISAAQVTLILPFISMYSLRDKTIFPYILAVVAGFMYDGASFSRFPVFAFSLLLVAIIAKNLFSKITSYGVERTGIILTLIGYFLILVASSPVYQLDFSDSHLYIVTALNLGWLLLIQLVSFRLFSRFFDWVEKTTSERYR